MPWKPNVSVSYIDSRRGRGVVARVDIKRNQLIEVCTVIAIVPHTRVFDNWELAWGRKVALVGGNAHFYNHSDHPNTWFRRDLPFGEIRVYAKRDIGKGEELTVRYMCKPWFEVTGK